MPDERLIAPPLLPPPNSIEAEQAVIGALMLAGDAMDRIVDIVSERDFYTLAHRILFRHAQGLNAAGKPIDAVTLGDALSAAGELDTTGGMAHLEALLHGTPTAANVEHYAAIVRDRSLRRDILALGNSFADLAHDRSRGAAEAVDQAQGLAQALGENDTAEGMVRIGDVLPLIVDDIENLHNAEVAGETRGRLVTSIPELDAMIPGDAAGRLIVIAARTAHGKTTLALQCAVIATLAGKSVAVFSLEMTAKDLGKKALAYAGSVHAEAMASGQMTADDWERLNAGIAKLHHVPLHIDGTSRITVERIRAKARKLKRRFGLGLVIVDYLQLLEGHGDSRNEQVSSITRSLKILANELACPVIALSQLNRKCEDRTDKRPQLSDLRDSGSVEQDADVVLFIYRDEVYYPDNEDTKGRAEISVAKNRGGTNGRVYCTFVGQYSRFAPTSWRPVPSRRAARRGMED